MDIREMKTNPKNEQHFSLGIIYDPMSNETV